MKVSEFRTRVEFLERRFGVMVAGLSLWACPGWLRLVERVCAELEAALTPDELFIVRLGIDQDSHGHRVLRLGCFAAPVPDPESDDRTWYMRRPSDMTADHVSRVREVVLPIARRLEEDASKSCIYCGAPGRASAGWSEPLDERVYGPTCERHRKPEVGEGFEWLTTPARPEPATSET